MQAAFGGLIAVILLGIYLHLIRVAYLVVNCLTTAGCTTWSFRLLPISGKLGSDWPSPPRTPTSVSNLSETAASKRES